MSLKISNTGIEMIKRFEGCRLQAYLCQAGVPTIGYGHTAGVKMGQVITQAQAEAFLKSDLVKFEQAVLKYDSTYHWNQNQFDALVSFAFNIGSIDQLTIDGTRDTKTIAQKMLLYNKASGKELAGLTERRKAEQTLFLKPISQNTEASTQPVPQGTTSGETEHVQLNYQPGEPYTIAVDDLRIRTKRASQDTLGLPNADIIGITKKGATVKNQATARVGDQIWMYIGLDSKSREQWICADNGYKSYIN